MGIFSRLFGGSSANETIGQRLYDRVLVAALVPALYEDERIADTFEGRFQSLTLHSALVMRRLRSEGAAGKALADDLYKRVFDGLDYAMREKGVGDSSIARKIRKFGEEFFGLARALDAGLDTGDDGTALNEALERNGLTPRLAVHVRNVDAALGATPREDLLAGRANLGVAA